MRKAEMNRHYSERDSRKGDGMENENRREILRAEGISYSYQNDREVLHQVSLRIGAGERIALLGENGAGKSTLFLNLNGVLIPDHGKIFLGGKPVSRRRADLNRLREKVGIVFQDPDQQMIAATVRQEVSFGPMNLKLPREEVIRRVDRAMEQMDLTDYAGRAPQYLSGGEKKRVSVADVLAMDPEVLIFDEPTASLDPIASDALERTLTMISDEGKTLLISTHDVDFAWRWADRVLVMKDGAIIADGTPEEIFTEPMLLERAHLKEPVMLSVYRALVDHGVLSEDACAPREPGALRDLLGNS